MVTDLRFVDLEHELQLQGGYLEMLEHHLADIVEGERIRIHQLYEAEPLDERAGLAFLEHDLDQGIPTRLFGAASVMGSWATYEAAVTEVAGELRQLRGIALQMLDLRGNFLQQARHYFRDVLQFTLHEDETVWRALADIAEIRHAFAHANGRTDHMPPTRVKRLGAIVRRYPGLKIVDNSYLVVTCAQARQFLDFITRELAKVFERAKQQFPA